MKPENALSCENRPLCAEYIWHDGSSPTRKLRSKTKIVALKGDEPTLNDFPEWSFDGSSTFQSTGGNSDLILRPVHFRRDPIRGLEHFLVLCEVFDENGNPHPTNTRAKLRQALEEGGAASEPWFGFEQEYTLYAEGRPLGWPEDNFPGPQGPYYCGVGNGLAHGRELVEHHLKACLAADIMIYGINSEVMLSQWEYQIGPRDIAADVNEPLSICDDHWLARWILVRLGEDYGVDVSFDNKPMKGDWNGAGQHTNFSTKETRDKATGLAAIEKAIDCLGKNHDAHIAVYGAALEERLTGHHETCHIGQFKTGVADRRCSIRIPRQVAQRGYGYIEDRRPGANADPYEVAERLIRTVCLS